MRIQKFAAIEPFVGALIDAEVTRIDRLRFQVRDQRPHLRERRRQAFEYAREKAQELAELGQMELGDVILVEEGVQDNYDADGQGGGMGGFGGVVHATPRRSETEIVPVAASQPRLPGLLTQASIASPFPLRRKTRPLRRSTRWSCSRPVSRGSTRKST